jgi:hypothetical protein
MEETLAFYGGAVKALGSGKISGYGVVFPPEPDLQGERFSKSTDLELEVGDRRSIYYRHGVHPVIKDRKLGKATLTEIDDAGAFFEGELNLRDEYEKYIYKLAEMGKLGWSTGSMPHLVRKELGEFKGQKVKEIKAWPIGEISLTPNPVEARTSAYPVKSLADGEIDELDAFIKSEEEIPFDTAGLPALDRFCKDVSPNSGANGEERSKSAVDAVKEFITAGNVLGEAFGVYTSRLLRRTENRAVKHADPVHPDTAVQVEGLLTEMDRATTALGSVKEVLADLKHLSDMSKAEQKAMMIKARHSLLNYYRISGYKPEELNDGGSTG